MLTRIVDWSLSHRLLVTAAAVLVAASGAYSFSRLPFDAFPDATPVQVQVNTVSAAAPPEEVERLLTIPVEQALAGLPNVVDLRSISKLGLSQVTLRFADGVDPWFVRQLVAERVARVRLPAGVEPPALGPPATGLGEVFHYVVRGRGASLEELRTAHDALIAPRLRAVPGVAEVVAWGGAVKQLHVVVDPLRLQKYDLTLTDVVAALERSNRNVAGGVVERAGAARLVLGVGALRGPAEVRDVVVATRVGVPIRIVDVARVEIGRELRRGAVTADGEGEVVLGLGFMLVGENSRDVSRALAAALAEAARGLPPGVEATPVYVRATLVDDVLRTVRDNLIGGALLVIAVLFLFLGAVRAGLLVALVVPLSLCFAFDGMLLFGVAGTLMSLGAIDFGLVVDSSVIVIENAERRLAEAGGRRTVREVVRDAAVEVRAPTLYGELVILVVYLPVLALQDVEGKMFRPMAATVMFALVGSMVCSLTLMPVLASLVLRPGAARAPRLVGLLQRGYAPILARVLAAPRAVVAAAALVVVAAIGGAAALGSEFVPRLSEGAIVVNTVRLAEVSLAESVRYGDRIEKVLLARFPDEIDRIWSRTGTAEVATDPMGVELTDVFVTLKPREKWRRATRQAELVGEMQAELADMPGMRASFLQPIEMRVNEMNAGVRGDVAIKLFGDDLELLKRKAREIEGLVRAIPGAADVSVEQVTGQPLQRIVVDRAAAARHGVAASDVLDVVDALGGRVVGELREGERRVPLAVTLPARFRDDHEALASIPVAAPDGARVPFGRLVTIEETTGPTTIQREGGKRRIVVQANVRGRDLGGFVADVRRVVDGGVALPPGAYVRYGGQHENLERARARLLVVVPAALLLVLLLLYSAYRSAFDAVRVFTGVPFALVGGVVALHARGMPFSISAAVGFVALAGIAVLNDMVLVSRVRASLAAGVAHVDAIREAATSRLRPVLMTSTVAALGFLPMALADGVGAEVQRPLATVVIGGVISSTLLTLLVLPALYALVGRRRREVA